MEKTAQHSPVILFYCYWCYSCYKCTCWFRNPNLYSLFQVFLKQIDEVFFVNWPIKYLNLKSILHRKILNSFSVSFSDPSTPADSFWLLPWTNQQGVMCPLESALFPMSMPCPLSPTVKVKALRTSIVPKKEEEWRSEWAREANGQRKITEHDVDWTVNNRLLNQSLLPLCVYCI